MIKRARLYPLQMIAIVALVLGMTATYESQAAGVQARGQGTYHYEGRFKKKNMQAYRQAAIDDAVRSAWGQYIGTLPQTRQLAYRQIEGELTSNLNRYVTNIVVLEESHDKKAKVVQVFIRAEISSAAVDAAFNANSAIQNAGGSGSLFTFIFTAREVISIKSFADKTTQISQSKNSAIASAGKANSGASTTVSAQGESFSKTVTGGNVESKAAKITYAIRSAQDIDTAMSDILTTAGYEVVLYGDVVSACAGVEPETIRAEFSVNDDISRQTRKSAIDASRECEVSYFSIGTIDIGKSDTDPITGNQRVYVSVRGQVWDITKRLPRKVASVGPVQFAGLGPDQTVASRNALIIAAKEAAAKLVAQMNAKGLY